MQYDSTYFDTVIDRRGTYCAKYDSMYQFFGSNQKLIDSLIPMWIADTEFRCPQELVEAVVTRAQHGAFGYGMLSGEKFRTYVQAWHERRNGIIYREEDIFMRRSTLVSLKCAVAGLSKIGDDVCLFTPTYGHFHQIVDALQRNVIAVHLKRENGRYTIDYDALERALSEHDVKLLIFCNPFNPAGRVWRHEELVRLIDICKRHAVPILSDEIHSDVIMPGNEFVPMLGVARELEYESKVIMCSSTSKTFNTAGMSIGYYIAPGGELKAAMHRAEKMMHETDPVTAFSYITIRECYEHGDNYVDALCPYVWRNFQRLQRALANQPWSPSIEITPLEGTYLAWIKLNDCNLDNWGATLHFVKHGIALEAGDQFYETEGTFIRLNLAAPASVIDEALTRLVRGLDDLYTTQTQNA